jgi:hypothetical protein
VFDLEEELAAIVDALNAAQLPYALCGGLAMAVHGAPRATVDIDLLVREEQLSGIHETVEPLGFVIHARPMTFSSGNVRIDRVSKIDPRDGETLMLDLLLVTPAVEDVWALRETRAWRGATLQVVSREGLIRLKQFRSSTQDRADIERLEDFK